MTTEEIMSRYDREIGFRVRMRRKEVGLSQAELGNVLGVTFQQVQKYENGANRISSSALVMIATTLKITPAELLSEVTPESAASSELDLARQFIMQPGGLKIAKALIALSTEDKARLADLAARMAELVTDADPHAYAKAA